MPIQCHHLGETMKITTLALRVAFRAKRAVRPRKRKNLQKKKNLNSLTENIRVISGNENKTKLKELQEKKMVYFCHSFSGCMKKGLGIHFELLHWDMCQATVDFIFVLRETLNSRLRKTLGKKGMEKSEKSCDGLPSFPKSKQGGKAFGILQISTAPTFWERWGGGGIFEFTSHVPS